MLELMLEALQKVAFRIGCNESAATIANWTKTIRSIVKPR